MLNPYSKSVCVWVYLQTLAAFQREGMAIPFAKRNMRLELGDLCLDDTAKLLGTGPDRLRKFLLEQQILIPTGKSKNLPHLEFVTGGLFTAVPGRCLVNGNPEYYTVAVTPKGRSWLFDFACGGGLDAI